MVRLLRRRSPTTYPESVLADASRLERSDPEAAIRMLTDANRARPDRRVEQRLLELREVAYGTLRIPRQSPPWPDQVEDLFPGQLIPEIDRRELTAERLRSGIRNHGSILVRNLVPADDVARLVTDIDTAFDAYDATERGDVPPELEGWYERWETDQVSDRPRRRSNGNLTTAESPPALFDLVDALDRAGVRQIAEQFFGEPPMMLARKATLRRIPRTGSGGWHQDGAFMGVDIRSLNIWLALSHCGDDAPGLDVAGRRFESLVTTGDDTARHMPGGFARWGVSKENAADAAADTIVRPIFEAGDALLFDHLCLHKTATEPGMTNGRYAIETWLFAPSTYEAMTRPAEQGYSPRNQLPIYF